MSDEPAVTPVAEPTPPSMDAAQSAIAEPSPAPVETANAADPVVTPTPLTPTPVAPPDLQPSTPPTPQPERAPTPEPQAQPVVSPEPATSSMAVTPPAVTTSAASTSTQVPVPSTPPSNPRSFLTKALAAIQFRKQAKLAKIMKFAQEKKTLTNDQVEKLLHVSDATASRYLLRLVKEGKLKKIGPDGRARYEPVSGSLPTN